MRLGELLIAAQVITTQQLEQALHAQVMWGARLGTSLVELGYIDLDGLSNVLAHQQRMPAALASHFDRADQELQLSLSANLAERYACVPLLRVGKRAAVVAAIGPLEKRATAILADELGFAAERLIISVAPELRIRYALERVYKIARPQRFLRAPGSARALPTNIVLPNVDLPKLDDPPELPHRAKSDTGDRRRYVQTLGESRSEEMPIAIDPDTEIVEIPDDDLPDRVTAIAAGFDREEVANLAIAAIRQCDPAADAALLLSLRGAVVVSSASFHRDGRTLPSIALPIDQPGAVAGALRTKTLVRTGPAELTELDRRLLSSLGIERGHLVVMPLVAGARVIAAFAVASRRPIDVGALETIAGAAAAGFARLMREATE